MWVIVDLCVVPLGVGTSLTPFIAACQKIIDKTGLDYELGPNGTSIEGEWNKVFDCIRTCHEEVHRLGASRIYTTVKINTRIDRQQSFREKVLSVNTMLSSDSG